VAAFALHVALPVKAVGLVALMATTAEFVFSKVGAPAGSVGLLMTVLAFQNRVFVSQRPASVFMIKAVFATFDRAPTHHVEAAAFVIHVAVLATLTAHSRRSVKPFPCPDPSSKVLVIVTVQAFVAVDGLAVGHVAVITAARIVEGSVLLSQRPRTRLEEI
jgi:hypothetical protein